MAFHLKRIYFWARKKRNSSEKIFVELMACCLKWLFCPWPYLLSWACAATQAGIAQMEHESGRQMEVIHYFSCLQKVFVPLVDQMYTQGKPSQYKTAPFQWTMSVAPWTPQHLWAFGSFWKPQDASKVKKASKGKIRDAGKSTPNFLIKSHNPHRTLSVVGKWLP